MEQPKKSKNAYTCFLDDKREELFSQVPPGEKKVPWLGKKAGEMWKAMSEEEKAPYVARAEQLKKAFEEDVEKFKAQGGIMTKKRKGDVKDLEVENGGPSTAVHGKSKEHSETLPHACTCFMNEKFAELFAQVPAGEETVPWVGKKAAEMWKAMTQAQQTRYVHQAARLKTAFEEELAEVKSASSSTVVDVKAMEQPKRPMHACALFMTEKRAELYKEAPAGEKTMQWAGKKAGDMWKALSEEERAPYVAQAERLKKAFEEEFEKFKAQGGVMTKKRKGNVRNGMRKRRISVMEEEKKQDVVEDNDGEDEEEDESSDKE